MSESIYHLRVTLRYSKPPIWRRVAVPSGTTLGQLHEIIQIAMGWADSHLHHFMLKDNSFIDRDKQVIARLTEQGRWDDIFTTTRGVRVFVPRTTPYGDDLDLKGHDEQAVTLAQVCPKVKSKLVYEYDFGDGWEHTLEVQKITEPSAGVAYPVCLAGKRACPPEDCGGVHGYYHLLGVIDDPDHEEHDDMIEWFGEGFDPEAFDINEVNDTLTQWRAEREKPNLRLVGL